MSFWDVEYFPCELCKEEFESSELIEEEDVKYCGNCHNTLTQEDLVLCDLCEQEYEEMDITSLEGKNICDDCFDDLVCSECNTNEKQILFKTYYGNFYCPDCYDEKRNKKKKSKKSKKKTEETITSKQFDELKKEIDTLRDELERTKINVKEQAINQFKMKMSSMDIQTLLEILKEKAGIPNVTDHILTSVTSIKREITRNNPGGNNGEKRRIGKMIHRIVRSRTYFDQFLHVILEIMDTHCDTMMEEVL